MKGAARTAATESLALVEATESRLLEALGHRFSDRDLLERALTHRSAGPGNNERLEFLGDAILNFLVAETLFDRVPTASEGRLTRLRASLVRRETLARVAREIGLGPALRLGAGELKSGGRDRDSILADALEALIGALYIDGGPERCRAVVRALFDSRVAIAAESRAAKDPKTALQEHLQSCGQPLPVYEVVEVSGAAHDQCFTVRCSVADIAEPTIGTGRSRRTAEQAAARSALEQVGAAHGRS